MGKWVTFGDIEVEHILTSLNKVLDSLYVCETLCDSNKQMDRSVF